MLRGFKDFALRGNVVELAVAVVIGAAFTAVVNAFATDFLTPLIGLVGGGGRFGGQLTLAGQSFKWGAFISQVITFVLTAAVVYFLVVVPMHTIMERRRRGEEPGPVRPTELELLTEIRDLLRAGQRATLQPAAAAPAVLNGGGPAAVERSFPPTGTSQFSIPQANGAAPAPPAGRPLPPVPPRRLE